MKYLRQLTYKEKKVLKVQGSDGERRHWFGICEGGDQGHTVVGIHVGTNGHI
jgi:hypothetical protein